VVVDEFHERDKEIVMAMTYGGGLYRYEEPEGGPREGMVNLGLLQQKDRQQIASQQQEMDLKREAQEQKRFEQDYKKAMGLYDIASSLYKPGDPRSEELIRSAWNGVVKAAGEEDLGKIDPISHLGMIREANKRLIDQKTGRVDVEGLFDMYQFLMENAPESDEAEAAKEAVLDVAGKEAEAGARLAGGEKLARIKHGYALESIEAAARANAASRTPKAPRAPKLKQWRKKDASPIYVDMNDETAVNEAMDQGYSEGVDRDAFREDAVRTRIVESFNRDPNMRKIQQIDQFSNLIMDVADSDNPIGHASLTTLMSRAASEVGNLSKDDRRPYGTSQALLARAKQAFEELYSGKRTPENLAFISDLADMFRKSAIRKKVSLAKSRAGQYSRANKGLGLTEDEVYEMLVPEMMGQPEEVDPEDAAAADAFMRGK